MLKMMVFCPLWHTAAPHVLGREYDNVHDAALAWRDTMSLNDGDDDGIVVHVFADELATVETLLYAYLELHGVGVPSEKIVLMLTRHERDWKGDPTEACVTVPFVYYNGSPGA